MLGILKRFDVVAVAAGPDSVFDGYVDTVTITSGDKLSTVDDVTMNKLLGAKENDLYLSGISPLGVPFNSLRGNTKDIEKQERIKKAISHYCI